MFNKFSQRLVDLGLVEDDTKKKVPEQKVAPQAKQPDMPGVGVALAAQGILDVPSITQDIEAQIHESPAFAVYKDFEAQLEKLSAVPGMNEPTRFIAAKATSGGSTEQLLAALETHGTVLATAADRFQKEFVASCNGEIESLKSKAEAAEQKIQDLTKELNAAVQDKADLIAVAQQKTIDLGKANIDFTGITTALAAKYQDLMNKVQQYLGVANGK